MTKKTPYKFCQKKCCQTKHQILYNRYFMSSAISNKEVTENFFLVTSIFFQDTHFLYR